MSRFPWYIAIATHDTPSDVRSFATRGPRASSSFTPARSPAWIASTRLMSRMVSRNSSFRSGHNPTEITRHQHIATRAIQRLHQPGLQVEVTLRAREQILHDVGERGTSPHELDHARWHVAIKELPQIEPVRQTGREFHFTDELPIQHGPVYRFGMRRICKDRLRRQIR